MRQDPHRASFGGGSFLDIPCMSLPHLRAGLPFLQKNIWVDLIRPDYRGSNEITEKGVTDTGTSQIPPANGSACNMPRCNIMGVFTSLIG